MTQKAGGSQTHFSPDGFGLSSPKEPSAPPLLSMACQSINTTYTSNTYTEQILHNHSTHTTPSG